MTLKPVITALNKEGIKAVGQLINLVFTPLVSALLFYAISQFNTIIAFQEAATIRMNGHDTRFTADSFAIADLRKEDYKLHRYDDLFKIKQDATKDALQNNSVIGVEFLVDYDRKYLEFVNENKFLNP